MESTYGGLYIRWTLHTVDFTHGGVYIRWNLHMVEFIHGVRYNAVAHPTEDQENRWMNELKMAPLQLLRYNSILGVMEKQVG